MTDLEIEFIGSLKALLIRHKVSLVYVNSSQLAFVSNDEDSSLSPEKFIYLSSEDVYKHLTLED